MNKEELKNKIKKVTSKILDNSKTEEEEKFVDLDNFGPQQEQFSYFQKFPNLKQTVVNLLTDKYFIFIKDVQWVAPKPTTFKIILVNNQYFFLIYSEHSWIAQIEGKKYYLNSLKDEQNALNSLSRILRYGPQEQDEKIPPASPSGEQEKEQPEEEV